MKLAVVGAVVTLGMGLLVAPPAHAVGTARPYDFDGNGYPDLAVGAAGLRVTTARDAGGVVVLPASRSGLSLREKIVTQSSRGVPGASEPGDLFGAAVASADFNSDGYADLAVGQPMETVGTVRHAGAVTIVYGSSRGLDTTRSTGMVSPAGTQLGAQFGIALVAGDFTGDNVADLAVGAPGEDVDLSEEDYSPPSGTVTVFAGGGDGITTTGAVTLRHQGGPSWDRWFGSELAAGDLDQDGISDLVVGSEGFGDVDGRFAGSVSYCPGRTGGPTGCSRLAHDVTLAGLDALAVGNMSGDSRPEVLVGVTKSQEEDTGHVYILQLQAGTPLTVALEHTLSQNSGGVPGSDEPDDGFGHSLAIGRINGDRFDDLVIGTPGEDAGPGREGVGRVTVVHGAASGWQPNGNYSYDQNSPGIPGAAEVGDGFGSSVTLLDHNQDGRLDLTIGAFGENGYAGAITTLRGSSAGFTTSGSRTFGLATLDYAYPAGALFGYHLGR